MTAEVFKEKSEQKALLSCTAGHVRWSLRQEPFNKLLTVVLYASSEREVFQGNDIIGVETSHININSHKWKDRSYYYTSSTVRRRGEVREFGILAYCLMSYFS